MIGCSSRLCGDDGFSHFVLLPQASTDGFPGRQDEPGRSESTIPVPTRSVGDLSRAGVEEIAQNDV
jgi:hypothetical protein